MQILDGKELSNTVRSDLKKKISSLNTKRAPTLAVVLIGDDPASSLYVKRKQAACKEVGIHSIFYKKEKTFTETELLSLISHLNNDESVDGILVQFPLPLSIDPKKVSEAIDPSKDVDGFHPINLGKLVLNDPTGFVPCTPLGIQYLFAHYAIQTEGKEVVMIGRSSIVGKPLALLLMQNTRSGNATVTLLHSRSVDIEQHTKKADILIAATGKAQWIKKEMVKPGAVIIDVGINRLPGGKVVGDVDFEKVAPIASYITPVPGGIGPLTIAMLLKNTFLAYSQHV